MQKEQALTEAPKWSGSELIRAGGSLIGTVGQTRPHVMQSKIGKGMVGDIRHRHRFRQSSRERGGVTKGAANAVK